MKTKLPNCQITKLPNYQATKLPSAKSLSHCVMAFILFLGSFLTSCQKKEELLQNNQKQNEAQFRRDPKACLTPIKLFCDSILWFENQEHFDAVYQCLEDAYEAHNDWFEQQTANMNDEEADEYAISINFDEDKPLIDFEIFHQFYSYRKWLSDNDLQWVNNSLNPLDYDFTLDDIENTLLSRSGMYRIGNQIVFYKDNNKYYIENFDCLILKNLIYNFDIYRDMYISEGILKTLFSEKKVHSVLCGFCLSDNEKESGENQYSSNKKYFWKMKFKKQTMFSPCAGGFCYKFKSKMINYKKNSIGIYLRSRIRMQIYQELKLYQDNNICDYADNIESEGPTKRRKSLKNKIVVNYPFLHYIINQSAYSTFAVDDLSANNQTKYININCN